jgi:hypothetical protein
MDKHEKKSIIMKKIKGKKLFEYYLIIFGFWSIMKVQHAKIFLGGTTRILKYFFLMNFHNSINCCGCDC